MNTVHNTYNTARSDFSRILTLLRNERGISQKHAALELGIKQSLLSHYERGIRECGLEFLVKVADYYSVSCDYLLGRSSERNGPDIDLESIPDGNAGKENVLGSGGVLPTLNKKIIVNSLNILFDLLAKMGNKLLLTEVSNFLMLSVYRMVRLVHESDSKNLASMFAIPQSLSDAYSMAAMEQCRGNAAVVSKKTLKVLPGEHTVGEVVPQAISPDSLKDQYPAFAASLNSLVKNSERRIMNTVSTGAELPNNLPQ